MRRGRSPDEGGLPGWSRRRGVGQEVQAELDAHFERTVELLVARGWSEEGARAEARAVFARTIAIVLVSATVAAAIPAWRATRVDPREALEDR